MKALFSSFVRNFPINILMLSYIPLQVGGWAGDNLRFLVPLYINENIGDTLWARKHISVSGEIRPERRCGGPRGMIVLFPPSPTTDVLIILELITIYLVLRILYTTFNFAKALYRGYSNWKTPSYHTPALTTSVSIPTQKQ